MEKQIFNPFSCQSADGASVNHAVRSVHILNCWVLHEQKLFSRLWMNKQSIVSYKESLSVESDAL
jgi:hypothetical protein